MAGAMNAAPTGFSYAQAARGTSKPTTANSQKPSSTSNTTSTSPPEQEARRDWAEESEQVAVAKEQGNHSNSNGVTEPSKQADVKSSIVERTKSEDKTRTISGVSSPDVASATSHDDSSSAVNGSSQTSWEAKSQVSEPAAAAAVPNAVTTTASSEPSWIAERKERQSNAQQKPDTPQTDSSSTNSNSTTILPSPKPPVLHEAPLPTVNPWAKRAEVAKAKTPAPTPSQPLKTPASNAVPKETAKPASGLTKPHASAPSVLESNAPAATSAATNAARPTTRVQNENVRPTKQSNKAVEQTVDPPLVRDNISWPTPETTVENEKKASIDDRTQDDREEGQGKPRKKQEWKPVPVVPNIIWQTPGVRERGAPRSAPSSEKAPRGGAAARGRGGFRGASGPAGIERSAGQATEQDVDEAVATTTQRGRPSSVDRAAMPPPSLPARASSGSSRTETDRIARQRKSNAASVTRGLPAQPNSASSNELPPNGITTTKDSATTSVNGTVDSSLAHDTAVKRDSSSETIDSTLPNGPSTMTSQTTASLPESRKESPRDASWNVPPRGARRGRGRGGNRDVLNSHASPFTNGHHAAGADFALASPQFGMPISPTFAPRGGHQLYNNSYSRAGPRTSGSRTQSFPMDAYYGRYPAPYMTPLNQLQTFQPAMADPNGFPASTIGFPGQTEPQMYMLSTVSHQLDYYFSVDNLLSDIFLRKNMDSQGFVFLDVVAGFKKLAKLTTDRELLKAACLTSAVIEIKIGDDGKERLRKASGWEGFVMPMEQRFPEAMNDGPQHIESVPRVPSFPVYPPQYAMPPQSHPASAYPGFAQMAGDPRSSDHAYAPMSMMSPQAMFVSEFASGQQTAGEQNGEIARGRHLSPTQQANGTSDTSSVTKSDDTEQQSDADTFPDRQIEQLTVCVKMSKERLPYHNSASRTFSNGSIDTSVVSQNGEKEKIDDKNGKSEQTNGDHEEVTSGQPSAQDLSVFWIKDNDKPVGLLPSDLTPEPYVELRHKALEQRDRAATGTCPYDLDVLYQFWSHFLIRNFNNSMYSDFKSYAEDDAEKRYTNVGRQNLIKYYDQALNSLNLIPVRVAKDYVALAKSEQPKQDSLVVKNLLRSWRNGALNVRNRKRITDVMDAGLRKVLEA